MRQMLGGLHSRYDRADRRAGGDRRRAEADPPESRGRGRRLRRDDRRASRRARRGYGARLARPRRKWRLCLHARAARRAAGARASTPDFLASAEARRLNEHAPVAARSLRRPALFCAGATRPRSSGPSGLARRRDGGGAKGHFPDAALQGPRRDEPGSALGDDARPRGALAACRSRSRKATTPTIFSSS